MKPLNAMFYGGREYTTTNFPFLFNWIKAHKNSKLGEIAYI